MLGGIRPPGKTLSRTLTSRLVLRVREVASQGLTGFLVNASQDFIDVIPAARLNRSWSRHCPWPANLNVLAIAYYAA